MNSQPHFLLITDNTSYQIGGPRYLGPYRLAHELEKSGIKTIVIDRYYSFPNFFEFLENLLNESYIGVGISTTFFTPRETVHEITRYSTRNDRSDAYFRNNIIDPNPEMMTAWFKKLRALLDKKSPRAKVFLGGSKVGAFNSPPFDAVQEIDFVVMGVVDLIFPKVIQDLLSGQEPQFRLIGKRKVIDTKTAYLQPKSCPKHEWLEHWHIQNQEALPIEIGRGCAFNCKFCNYDKKDNTRKSLEDLRAELVTNYEKHGTRFYHFVDDCFNDNRGKVEEVCNLILSLPFKIEWVGYARFDVAVRFPETADLMVKAGARGFHWGVESLTSEVARRAGKGTPSEKIKDFIVEFSRKHQGLAYSTGSFITGLPGETRESWMRQLDWLLSEQHFNFIQLGPLGISPYKAEFDGNAIDYADYSRNPQKYGFTEISHNPRYWRHETMDLYEAEELSDYTMLEWSKKNASKRGISTDIWIYPLLRALGFSEAEVFDCYFNPDLEIQQRLIEKGRPVHQSRLKNYYEQMQSLGSIKKQSSQSLERQM